MIALLRRHGVKVFSAAMDVGAFTWKRYAAAVVVGSASLIAVSCDESTSPRDHLLEGSGIVQGHVLGSGQPVAATVRLLPVSVPWHPVIETQSDSTGWYTLTAPVGRYLLAIALDCYYSHHGLVQDSRSADTLVLIEETRRIDLVGGAARLRIEVPPVLRERTIWGRFGSRNAHPHAGTWHGSRSDSGTSREFYFPLLAPGPYVAQLDFDSGPALWLPPTLDREKAGTFQVQTATTTTITATLPEPAWISGEITTGSQEFPFWPPTILVFKPDSTLLDRMLPIWEPEYRLILPMAERVKLGVQIWNRTRWIGGDDFYHATLFDPAPGEEITGVDLAESGIACSLDRPDTTFGYDGDVRLYDHAGTPAPGTCIEGNGAVFFVEVQPGTYFLHFERRGWDQRWYSQWYDGAESRAAATPITVATLGEVVAITAHLREGGRISGRVLRPGQPEFPLWISVRRTNGDLQVSNGGHTNLSDGTFEAVGLNDGDYQIGVVDPGCADTYWCPGTYDPDSAQTFRIENHNAIAHIEWTAPF